MFNFPSCLPKDDCYDPVDSPEIPLFDDACYDCGHDANMNDAYGDELAIVPYVKNEIFAIAPTHDSPIIFLNSPNYTISEKFAPIKDYVDGLHFTVAHDDFDRYNCWGSLQKLKFSTHHQDQSMKKLATRERGVHLHTLEDCDAEALQEHG